MSPGEPSNTDDIPAHPALTEDIVGVLPPLVVAGILEFDWTGRGYAALSEFVRGPMAETAASLRRLASHSPSIASLITHCRIAGNCEAMLQYGDSPHLVDRLALAA